LLRNKLHPEEALDHPALVLKWLELGLHYIEDVRVNFIEQVLKFEH